jgi:hypothetical protein
MNNLTTGGRTRRCEIIIALIGGFSIVVAAFINAHYNQPNCKESNKLLKITSINLENQENIEGIRISGRVDQDYFAYPLNSFLVSPKNYLPADEFPVKVNNKEAFEVSIELMAQDNSCQIHSLRPLNQFVIPANDVKYSGVYKLLLIDSDIKSNLSCEVEFKIY